MIKQFLIIFLVIQVVVVLTACGTMQNQNALTGEAQTVVPEYDTSTPESLGDDKVNEDESDISRPDPFSKDLPPEFMAFFEGHELPIEDNPMNGIYQTASGCIMILMSEGYYVWQDPIEDATAITGYYEIFEGTVKGQDNGKNVYTLKSDTGPLYTVIVTFNEGQASMPGTIQVFDYIDEGFYYVTDMINNIWFEVTRISD